MSIRLNDQCKLVVAGLKVWHANADNGVPASTIDYGDLLSDDGRESAETGVSGASGSSGATRYKASGESEWTSVGGYRAFTRLRFDYEEGHDGLRLVGMFSLNCPHTFPYSWMGVNGPCREYPETVSRSLIKGVAGTQFWVDEVANTDGNFIWIQKTTMTISRGYRASITCTSSKNWVAEGWDGLDCEGRVRER